MFLSNYDFRINNYRELNPDNFLSRRLQCGANLGLFKEISFLDHLLLGLFCSARLLVSSRVELHVPSSMSLSNTEQAIHDRINLSRLVKRIEKSAAEDDWSHAGGIDLWARAQGTLQVSTSPACLYLFKRRFCCGWSENTTCKEIVEECRSR